MNKNNYHSTTILTAKDVQKLQNVSLSVAHKTLTAIRKEFNKKQIMYYDYMKYYCPSYTPKD